MSNILVFDIETVGGKIDELPLCDKNKDYLRGKIEKKREKKGDERSDEDKERDFCGLDVDLAKVICIGIHDGENTLVMVVDNIAKEVEVIRWFWEKIEELEPKRVVTFNGKAFDVPILIRRTIEYQITPTKPILSLERYDTQNHLDLAEYLGSGYPSNLKRLDFYCDLYGICKDSGGHEGNEIRQLFDEGKTEEISRKCKGDVEATYQLYTKVIPYVRR